MAAERDGTTYTSVGTVEDLHASATRMTGLADFGRDDYSDGLAMLLESYESEADLMPFGRRAARAGLRGALAARLLCEAGWAAHPEHAAVPIERPIFVTGLPRSGTTALHRLLTSDPGHQGLELWLAEAPQPRPPRSKRQLNKTGRACLRERHAGEDGHPGTGEQPRHADQAAAIR